MDLETAIDKIEMAGKILTRFDPEEFENSDEWITHDIGVIIQKECAEIREIL